MGLDTTAYERFEWVDDHPDRELVGEYEDPPDEHSCYEKNHRRIYSYSEFADHALAGFGPRARTQEKAYFGNTMMTYLEGVVLTSGETNSTHRSYGGHSMFRNALRVIGEWDMLSGWEGIQSQADKPFYELVNFSDCEGVLGPIACANLYEDFVEYADRAQSYFAFEAETSEYGDWRWEHYQSWMRSFEITRDTGFVDFH